MSNEDQPTVTVASELNLIVENVNSLSSLLDTKLEQFRSELDVVKEELERTAAITAYHTLMLGSASAYIQSFVNKLSEMLTEEEFSEFMKQVEENQRASLEALQKHSSGEAKENNK